MDERENAFLQTGTALPPQTSRLAILSAAVGIATITVMVLSAILFSAGFERAAVYVAFLQLIFPAAIVLGHMAKNVIAHNSTRYKGRGLALLGLYIGYFNLIMVVMIVFFIFSRTG